MTWSFGWCQNEKCESFQLQGVYHCLCTCQNWRHQNYLFLEESREFRMVLGPQFHLNTLVENRPESRHYRHRHRHRHTHTYSYIPFHYVQLHAIAYSYSYICTHLHTHTHVSYTYNIYRKKHACISYTYVTIPDRETVEDHQCSGAKLAWANLVWFRRSWEVGAEITTPSFLGIGEHLNPEKWGFWN